MINNSFSNIRKREKNDVFYTPENLSRKLISSVPVKPLELCFDPFKGQGSFFDNMRKPSVWGEIEEGRDFFEFDSQVDWIISNPPFSMITKILEHSMKISRKGFGYILPTYSLTTPRLELIRKGGFSVSKIIYFRTPKSWEFGYSTHFVLFQRDYPSIIEVLEEVFV